MEYETDYQTSMSRLLDEQLVHPDDADEFRSIVTLDQLRLRMFHEKRICHLSLPQKIQSRIFLDFTGTFSRILNVPKENPWVVMVIHESPSVNPDL